MTERERRPESDGERGAGSVPSADERFEEAHAAPDRVTEPGLVPVANTGVEFLRQTALGRVSMREHRNVLAVLATSAVHQPAWVLPAGGPAIHEPRLAGPGGLPGIRDANALESALARPRSLFAYDRLVDIAHHAAA